ncbi:hypothetical protein TUM19329_09060 [Legionella antarctica]|uniref:Transmembrane protein n=1 Tax=Legionella antarctica TaxID=2708020 RepID=A0A6F8T1L0_9GAMM|nr:hypothetical protein [Legionella antarctica]BCA94545.1 hypothetical protein TUM19329_09060 [Legionella antarctica]
MFIKNSREYFKKIIIIFWTLWWFIALWTDIVGGLAHYGLLVKSWAPDTNYPFILNSLKMYPLPEWIPPLLFIGILLWSLLSTVVFCWACASLNKNPKIWMHRADIAFIVSLGFWLAFFLADQLVMKFDLEENHMVQGGFQLLTYLTLYLLPSGNQRTNQ